MQSCRPATPEELNKAKAITEPADYYSMLGFKFKFCSSMPEISSFFRHVYRQFLLSQPCSIDYEFFLLENGKNPLLLVNDQAYPLCWSNYSPSQVHMIVFSTIANQITEHFLFHAAALSRENQGIIIVGSSGSGKTSLALKLAHERYEFLSDEFAPIHCQNLKLYPFPRSLGLRQGTLKLFPHLKNQPLLHNVDVTQDENWLMEANCLSPGDKPCSLKAIYFLDSDQGKGDFQMNMGLYEENSQFATALNAIPGVSFIHQAKKGDYPVYRFRIKRGNRCLINFYKACQPFKELLIYREEIREKEIDFSRERKFVPLDKSTAAIELLKHLLNRTRRNKLRRELQSMAQFLIEMGRIVEGVECWRVEEYD